MIKTLFHRRFEKKFTKLSAKLKKQFKERKDLFIVDPYNRILNNHPLKGKYSGCYSINITGDIRAVYEFVGKDVVYFIDIDTHPHLYRS